MTGLTAEERQHLSSLPGGASYKLLNAVDDLLKKRHQQGAPGQVAWGQFIRNMAVSVDVSTGDNDADHRIFGHVEDFLFEANGAKQDTILVVKDRQNFEAPVAKDHEVRELVGRLTAIAKEFHAAGQLRERIAQEIRPFQLIKKSAP